MNTELITKYFDLCSTVELILIAFRSFYLAESRSRHMHYLVSKQRINLIIDHRNLHDKLTNLHFVICDIHSAYQIYFSH